MTSYFTPRVTGSIVCTMIQYCNLAPCVNLYSLGALAPTLYVMAIMQLWRVGAGAPPEISVNPQQRST